MNAPFPHLDQAVLSSTGHVPAARWGEENDTYPAVAALNDRWRVIVCKNSIQWILQRRRSGPNSWRGRSFCCTREALIRCVREHAGQIGGDALVILLRLPERIGVANDRQGKNRLHRPPAGRHRRSTHRFSGVGADEEELEDRLAATYYEWEAELTRARLQREKYDAAMASKRRARDGQ